MQLRPSISAILLLAGAAFAQKVDNDKLLLGDLPTVEAVSLHAQTLAEAPARVTVIQAAEIRRYGYRTLAEALASVAGFYVTYDHEYHYVGVSGISLPGDFNTRFLVMLNGHPLTDNIYNSNGFFGQDFGVDLDLVERIEIIRGPTSALYGSNGILANINVVTRSPVDAERLRVRTDIGSGGERHLAVSSAANLGHGANLLLSASLFDNHGSFGEADGERGYHTFAQLIWHDWSLSGYFNSRNKQTPVGVGTSLSDDVGQRVIDQRNFVNAAYRHSAGPGKIQWQTAFDQYRYRDRYDYPVDDSIETVRDFNRGDWVDSQLAYELPVPALGPLTVGASGSWDLRAEQYNLAEGLKQDYTNRLDRGGALFVQQEWKASARWQIYGGVRLDYTRFYGRALSPRIAVVYQRSPQTVYKFVYGRPFRNPGAFEQFYNDGGLSYVAADPLRPEVADAWEFSVERRLASRWSLAGSAYRYRIAGVIEAMTLDGGAQQYRNGSRDRSQGVELSLSGKLRNGVEMSASSAFGRADRGIDRLPLPNSPGVVSKARFGVPVGGSGPQSRLFMSANVQYTSARRSWSGDRLSGFLLADFNGTVKLNSRFDVQVGMRNGFDRHYEDAIWLAVDRMRGDGRSFYLRLICHAWE